MRNLWCCLIAMVVAAMVVSGCSSPRQEFPTEAPDIVGLITTATTGDGTVTLLIELPEDEKPPAWSSYMPLDKASVTVTEATLLYDSNGDEVEMDRLTRTGQRVRAWFTGPVAESYPVQATARAVQLVTTP